MPGRVVFLATNGLSTSLDLKDHGMFTKVLLDGLKGEADNEGYEPDGLVTVDELAKYLDKQMPELARKYGKTEEEKEQAHFVLGGRGNHFVLTHNPAVAAKVKERLDKFGQAGQGRQGPGRSSPRRASILLERMPRLEAQRNLRKDYQELVDGKIDAGQVQGRRATTSSTSTKLKRGRRRRLRHQGDRGDAAHQGELRQGGQPGRAGRLGHPRPVPATSRRRFPTTIEARLKNAKEPERGRADRRCWPTCAQRAGQARGPRQAQGPRRHPAAHAAPTSTRTRPTSTRRRSDSSSSDIDGNFTGIGIQIRKDAATDMLLVVTPIKGSPAYKAGLQAGDIITNDHPRGGQQGQAARPSPR